MNFFEFFIIVFTLVTVGSIATQFLKNKAKQTSRTDEKEIQRQISDLEHQNEKLVKRLEVLETIVTSEGYELRRQFSELDNVSSSNNR